MSDPQRLPDGCRVDIHTFVISDKTGLEARLSVKNLPVFLMPKADITEIVQLLPHQVGDWRLMTNAEVKDYLAREKEEEVEP